MIKNLRHKGLNTFFQKGKTTGINSDHAKKLRIILTYLNAIESISDMNFPGSGLHKLSGEKRDFWSVRVSGNYRIIFRFYDPG